jgi:MFS family permease
VVFGYSPLESGVITFVSAIGAFGMRTVARRILRRFGFRRVLIWNTLIASASMALCASFTPGTAPFVMMIVIFTGGVFRALQFTSINTLAFAEASAPEMSHATALSQMAQRISQSVGVAFAAILLHLLSGGAPHPTGHAFAMAFLVVALVSALSCFSFLALPETAGDVLAGRAQGSGRDPEAGAGETEARGMRP